VKWDDLAMVNLQSKGDGGWSYTAYKKPFSLWRSNKGLPDVFACVEDIMHEICLADDLEGAAAVHEVLRRSIVLDESIDASGGISGKPAKVRKAKKK
jgi:hypothetical protein